jgi:hypothetical protein
MAFRLYDPAPVFMDLAGTAPAAAGTLETYSDEACTTPLVTYNSPDLDVANPTEIDLDADGRASVEIWSSVAFFLRLKESDGTVVWTREITSGVPAGLVLPELDEGEYITGDGAGGYAAATLMPLPDPTGSADYMVVVNADGDGYELQAQPTAPEAPELDITIASGSLIVGDGTNPTPKMRLLCGTGSGTSTGGRTQTTTVTFAADSFSAAPTIFVPVLTNASGLSPDGNVPIPRVTVLSATGATIVWTMGELDDTQTDYDFNTGVAFMWFAMGLYEEPEA